MSDELLHLVQQAAVICFSTLAQRDRRSGNSILQLLDSVTTATIRILDINLRSPFHHLAILEACLKRADWIKVSDEEYPQVAAYLNLPSEPSIAGLRQLLHYGNQQRQAICLTRGSEGAWLLTASEFFEALPLKVEAKNRVGAGDAFTAALTVARLHGQGWQQALEAANRYAASVVAGQPRVLMH